MEHYVYMYLYEREERRYREGKKEEEISEKKAKWPNKSDHTSLKRVSSGLGWLAGWLAGWLDICRKLFFPPSSSTSTRSRQFHLVSRLSFHWVILFRSGSSWVRCYVCRSVCFYVSRKLVIKVATKTSSHRE